MLTLKLNGNWDAWIDQAVADQFHSPGCDLIAQYSLPVPGHWQQTPELSDHQGSVFYRKTFSLESGFERLTWRLQIMSAFYLTTVWINGQLVGEHEGYFQPMRWEIPTDLLQPERNVVAIRVDCPPPGKTWRETVLGAFGDWDVKPAWVNPGGIAGDVLLVGSQGGFWQDLVVDSRLSAWNAAQIKIKGQLLWRQGQSKLTARLTVTPRNFVAKTLTQDYVLAVEPGENQVIIKFQVPDPKLWWTWDLGYPSLYDLSVSLLDGDGQLVEHYQTHLGFRTIKWEHWQLYLNGRRLFLRGSNYTPVSFYPATVTETELERDVSLMVSANLNFVRVHAHVAQPEFYRACAEQGMLIWQDFPLDKRYEHDILETAITQVRQMVTLLSKEPAIAFWACHNEPYALSKEEQKQKKHDSNRLWGNILRSSRFTWNKNVLDSRLRAAVMQLDAHRPVFAYSGVFGFLRGGSDTHQYFGWNTASYRMLQSLASLFPQSLRLVTEYGAQSWPLDQDLLAEVNALSAWPQLPWGLLHRRYLLDADQLHAHVNPADYANLADYASATQAYQAELLQFYHETLRRKRFRPCAGAVMFCFADACRAVTWSMVDWRRQPKLAYQVTRRAMRPVQVMVDWPRHEFQAGTVWNSRIYVVNDLQRPMPTMGLTWQLRASSGEVVASDRRIADVGPDQVVVVGRLGLKFPEDIFGLFTLSLALDLPNGERIENEYRVKVVV